MLKVLLIDDEPFILQGLTALIDWKAEGFEIAAALGDGQQAYEYLRQNRVDLIFADIRMPVMDGLALLKRIREEKISDAQFVVLSGYSDFAYAQDALRNGCFDYLVKPVARDDLRDVLSRVSDAAKMNEESRVRLEEGERALFVRKMLAILYGHYDREDLVYVQERIRLSSTLCYVGIELPHSEDDIGEQEYRNEVRRVFERCREYLGEDADHVIFDVATADHDYEIGFIWCDYMCANGVEGEKDYLLRFSDDLCNATGIKVRMLAGKRVEGLENLARSFTSAYVMKSFEGFRDPQPVSFYEKEVQVHDQSVILCKTSLDALIVAIEENDPLRIRACVDSLYEEMGGMGLAEQTVRLNIHYLLFQLIHIASDRKEDVNQEEILHYISENTLESGMAREGSAHLKSFACDYAAYLAQLKQEGSNDVLNEVNREIREHYAENLSLRDLGKKYYINSSYLGQLYRRTFGVSFKEALTGVRIEEAARMLRSGNEPVARIAEKTGYRDVDYFIRKFIEVKGCTPSKYRRNQLLE